MRDPGAGGRAPHRGVSHQPGSQVVVGAEIGEIRSAFDRKELDLTGRCNDQDVAVLPHWVAEQFATPLFYFGDPAKWVKSAQAEGKFPWYKEALEVVTPTPVQRAVLDTYLSWS